MSSCHRQSLLCDDKTSRRPPVRSALALGLSLLVAFFPKCPMCWAAYSGALGIASIVQIPYMGFLFPVLVALLGLHLWLLFKQAARVGHGPFLISVGGAVTLLLVRYWFPHASWALKSGILLMLLGSIWNSFSLNRMRSAIRH